MQGIKGLRKEVGRGDPQCWAAVLSGKGRAAFPPGDGEGLPPYPGSCGHHPRSGTHTKGSGSPGPASLPTRQPARPASPRRCCSGPGQEAPSGPETAGPSAAPSPGGGTAAALASGDSRGS